MVNANSILVMIFVGVVTPLCIAANLIWSFFDPTGNGPHRVARIWARLILAASRVKVEVLGAGAMDWKGPYVFAANHASTYDILVLLAYLPIQFRWMAKQELFRIPFFGWAMHRSGYIPVNRSNPREGLLSLERAAQRIRAGTSVIIFPEGTRSRDGRIHEFKRGGFTLAVKAGSPVVPVSISGTYRVLPAPHLTLTSGPVRIVLGRPIPTEGVDRDSQLDLIQRVQQEIQANFVPDYGSPTR